MAARVGFGVALAWLLAGTTGAAAMFAAMSAEELFARSTLVVTGEVDAVQADDAGRIGHLAVSGVLKGAPVSEARVLMTPPGGLRASSDVEVPVGTPGLWFLLPVDGAEGLYRIDHPQRFVPADAADAVIERLRRD